MNQGPRWILMMKKTREVKSRATVPLRKWGFVFNKKLRKLIHKLLEAIFKHASDMR
jgi:hypothetical protein